MMFELEDFDLDDEIFLNTQMPVYESPVKSPNTNSNSLNLENNDEKFLDLSNADHTVKTLHHQNVKLNSKTPEKQNKNTFCNTKPNTFEQDEQMNIKNPANKCQSNKIQFHPDDDFDSDDDAFFNMPDVSLEPLNLLKVNSYSSKINLDKDHNESSSSFNIKSQNAILHCSKIESTNTLNCNSRNSIVKSVKTITPKCASRKFPGPAGLLTENEDFYSEDPSNLESLDMSFNITDNDQKEESLCIQANDFSFSSSPYQQFLSDFFTTDVHVLLDKYNVAWIKQKLLPFTASGRFFIDKIPFFVSVIKEIDCLSPDPTVLLADKTGHIRGTIHRAVWNEFSGQLKLGSVLILSKVGVSCQKILKGFTLNITNDHLMAIYSSSSENVDEVIVTRTTELTNEQIVNDAKRWNMFSIETSSKNPQSDIRSRISALNNLKIHNISLSQSSQLSDVNYHTTPKETIAQSTPVKEFFKPKTAIAHNFLSNDSKNLSEEPPTKRKRNEECNLKANEQNSNEISIIQNIFEGIDESEMFDDFYC